MINFKIDPTRTAVENFTIFKSKIMGMSYDEAILGMVDFVCQYIDKKFEDINKKEEKYDN